MAELVTPGNATPLGKPSAANSSTGREDMIVNKTKEQTFPTGPVISLESFEHFGDKPAGWQQSFGDMSDLSGKQLQESYRVGHPKSADMTDKVSDR
jgi:hypothetical protein